MLVENTREFDLCGSDRLTHLGLADLAGLAQEFLLQKCLHLDGLPVLSECGILAKARLLQMRMPFSRRIRSDLTTARLACSFLHI
jgi:hypothetical protein